MSEALANLKHRTLKTIVRISAACSVERGTIVVAAVSALVFTVPDQMREIYRANVEGLSGWTGVVAYALSLAGQVSVLALSIVYCGIRRFAVLSENRRCMPGADEAAKPSDLWQIIVLCTVLPFLALAVGHFLARMKIEDPPDFLLTINGNLDSAGMVLAAVSVVVLILAVMAGRVTRAESSIIGSSLFFRRRYLLPFLVLMVAVVIGAGLVVPIHFLMNLSVVFLVAVFFAILLGFVTVCFEVYDRYRIPLLTGFFLFAVVLSATDWNDNHIIRSTGSLPDTDRSVEFAFAEWLAHRGDLDYFHERGLPYPVYIVASEGGGIYAAYNAGLALSRLQDSCPSFAQHLFAISGVSGGALGATGFAALAHTYAGNDPYMRCQTGDGDYVPNPEGFFESRTQATWSHDLLAPLVWAALFPDFLQRFLPVAVPEFDRARALEDAFAAALDVGLETHLSGFPRAGLARSWDPTDATPALFMNTTWVEHGESVVVSPLTIALSTSRRRYLTKMIDHDIPIATAAVMSARFPWITPVATVEMSLDYAESDEPAPRLRLADGGYFDNSGIETAADLSSALAAFWEQLGEPKDEWILRRKLGNDAYEQLSNMKIRPIIVSIQTYTESGTEEQFLGELASPIRALLNMRSARGKLAVSRARDLLCPGCDDFVRPSDNVFYLGLNGFDFPLPLGWHLSKLTQRYIEANIGHPLACRTSRPEDNRLAQMQRENSCTMQMLLQAIDLGL